MAGASRLGAWLSAGPIRPGIRSGGRRGIFRAGNCAGEAHPVIAEGISICPETAVCFDCLEKLHAAGSIGTEEEVVVFNTGAAQKYPEAVPLDLPWLDKNQPVDYPALAVS